MNNYIKYKGIISSIRNTVDKDYIWFDIYQKENFKGKDGKDRNNLSFFSARLSKKYKDNVELRKNKTITVEGIPNGYIDKNGCKQNYIHVLTIDGHDIDKLPYPYRDGYWNGVKIEYIEATPEEQAEMQRMIDEITGGK